MHKMTVESESQVCKMQEKKSRKEQNEKKEKKTDKKRKRAFRKEQNGAWMHYNYC